MFCAPIFLFVIMSGSSDSALVLLIPMFGAVPAVIGTFLIFMPIEAGLDAAGLGPLKNVAVPAAGGLFIVLFVLVMSMGDDTLTLLIERLRNDPVNVGGPLLFWMVLGVVWGVLWRASAWMQALLLSRR